MTVRFKGPAEIRFVDVDWPINAIGGVVACSYCMALIPDDDEGANRYEHAAWHRDVFDTLRALRDGKAEAI